MPQAVQNLIKDAPFTRLDLVSCRNLLIYLGAELQHQPALLLHYRLNPRGCLVRGASEDHRGVHRSLLGSGPEVEVVSAPGIRRRPLVLLALEDITGKE
jgi:chemotaxis methyl-accepting protein methylase